MSYPAIHKKPWTYSSCFISNHPSDPRRGWKSFRKTTVFAYYTVYEEWLLLEKSPRMSDKIQYRNQEPEELLKQLESVGTQRKKSEEDQRASHSHKLIANLYFWGTCVSTESQKGPVIAASILSNLTPGQDRSTEGEPCQTVSCSSCRQVCLLCLCRATARELSSTLIIAWPHFGPQGRLTRKGKWESHTYDHRVLPAHSLPWNTQ